MKPEFANITYDEYCDYLKRSLYEYLIENGLEAIIEINDRLDDSQTELKPKDRRNNIWLEAWFGERVICFELGTQKRCEIRPIMSWEWIVNCRWYFKKKGDILKSIYPREDVLEFVNIYPSHDLKTQITRLKHTT